MGSLWRLVRVLVVPCGRRGFRILALASLALGLHIWLAGSVLAPYSLPGTLLKTAVHRRALSDAFR